MRVDILGTTTTSKITDKLRAAWRRIIGHDGSAEFLHIVPSRNNDGSVSVVMAIPSAAPSWMDACEKDAMAVFFSIVAEADLEVYAGRIIPR